MAAQTIISNVTTGAQSVVNLYPQVQQAVEQTVKTATKIVDGIDRFGDLLIEEIKKKEEERKRANISLSQYVSPAYDDHELLELFQVAKETERSYIIIRKDEIKKKTIEKMNEDKKMKYRFTTPSKEEVYEARPDMYQSCCLIGSVDVDSLIKINFSLI